MPPMGTTSGCEQRGGRAPRRGADFSRVAALAGRVLAEFRRRPQQRLSGSAGQMRNAAAVSHPGERVPAFGVLIKARFAFIPPLNPGVSGKSEAGVRKASKRLDTVTGRTGPLAPAGAGGDQEELRLRFAAASGPPAEPEGGRPEHAWKEVCWPISEATDGQQRSPRSS